MPRWWASMAWHGKNAIVVYLWPTSLWNIPNSGAYGDILQMKPEHRHNRYISSFYPFHFPALLIPPLATSECIAYHWIHPNRPQKLITTHASCIYGSCSSYNQPANSAQHIDWSHLLFVSFLNDCHWMPVHLCGIECCPEPFTLLSSVFFPVCQSSIPWCIFRMNWMCDIWLM